MDITERKKTETAMIWMSAIVESSGDAIIGEDLSGIISSWNKGAERLFGYAECEALAASVIRLIPEGREEEEHQILERIRRGESVKPFETVRQTRDGRLIDVSVTASAIRDETGMLIGVSKVARDITQRRRLEAQRGRLADIVEASPDFIGFADPKTMQMQYINKHGRRMCGIGDQEDVGNLKISDVHPPWMNQRIAEVVLPAALREGAWEGEGAFRTVTGARFRS